MTIRRDLHSAVLAGALSGVLGLVVGVLWRLAVPLPVLQNEGGVALPVGGTETAVAADGWFAVLAGVAGVVVAVALVALVRRGRLGVLVGLVAGGVLGAVVAWRTGVLLGPPSVAESLSTVPAGDRFDGPLEISAPGVMLAWPTAAVISFFAIVAGLEHDQEYDDGGEQAVPAAPGAAPPVEAGQAAYADGALSADADGALRPDGRWVPPAPR